MNGVAIATKSGVSSSGAVVAIDRSGISKIPIGCRASTADFKINFASSGAKWWKELKTVRIPVISLGIRVASIASEMKQRSSP